MEITYDGLFISRKGLGKPFLNPILFIREGKFKADIRKSNEIKTVGVKRLLSYMSTQTQVFEKNIEYFAVAEPSCIVKARIEKKTLSIKTPEKRTDFIRRFEKSDASSGFCQGEC